MATPTQNATLGINIMPDQADIQKKIADIQGQIATAQQQITNARQAGITSGQIPANVLNAPAQSKVPANMFGAGAGTTGGFDFGSALQVATDRLNTINPLTNTRQLLIKGLFDSPLTPEEIQSLPQEYQTLVNTGNRQELEMGIRLLNDNISGRMGTMDQSVQFLTNLYTKGQENLETKKQQEIENVLKMGAQYGDKAASVFDSVYGTEKLDTMSKQYGMDFRTLLSTPTLEQTKAAGALETPIKFEPDMSAFTSTLSPAGLAVYNQLPQKDQLNVMFLLQGDALVQDIAKGIGGAKYAQVLLGYAKMVDPTFSETVNKVRYNAKLQWSNPQGKSFLLRSAINTALGHLAQLKLDADALDNKMILKYNTVANMIKKETGNPAVTNFNYTLTVLASEIASAYKGSGAAATDQETEAMKTALSVSYSPKQLSGLINQASKLLSSKITAVAQEYKNVMGAYPTEPIVQDYILQQLKDAGVNTIEMEKVLNLQSNAPIETAGGNMYQSSSGNTYTLPY